MTARTNNTLEEVIVHVLSVLTEKQIHKLTLFNKMKKSSLGDLGYFFSRVFQYKQ